jgi:hypothetical protein
MGNTGDFDEEGLGVWEKNGEWKMKCGAPDSKVIYGIADSKKRAIKLSTARSLGRGLFRIA